MVFKTSNGIYDIKEWQKHIMRSRNQMRAKTKAISELSDSSVIVMVDWAMKFLPRKFREGQTDWFAKRGINWHIGVCLSKSTLVNAIETLTFVHLFANPISQDAFTTSAVLVDIAKTICKIKPEIQSITFWSDNAGCYKSTLTLCTLFSGIGSKLKAYHFCEAQDGKGPCDRKASHIKADIKRYVNEGHDVLEAISMKKAIDSKQRSFLCKVVECDERQKPTVKSIPNITSYNNFLFAEDSLSVWKAYGIGQGKHLPWNKIGSISNSELAKLKIVETSCNVRFTAIKQTVTEPQVEMQDSVAEAIDEVSDTDVDSSLTYPTDNIEQGLFCCPVEGCIKSYIKYKSLEDHLTVGECSFKVQKEPQF